MSMSDRRPFIPYNKTHYGNRPIDPNIIDRFFSLIEDGDVYKLKEYILSSNINASVRNEKGETLLHATLNSMNLTKETKLEITRFLIDQGVAVGLSDINNVTPLHIACKEQLPEIVELLCKHGASPNFPDNKRMSPLHYQVMGKSELCTNENRKNKIGLFDVKPNTKEKYTLEIRKINKSLLDTLYKYQPVRKYLSHIKKTFLNIHNMYPIELSKIQNDLLNEITRINTEGVQNMTKDQYILNQSTKTRDSIYNNLSGKLMTSLASMAIGINSEITNDISDILPLTMIQLRNNMKQELNKKIIDGIDNLRTNATGLVNNVVSIENGITSFSELLGTIIGNLVHVDGNNVPIDDEYNTDLVHLYRGRTELDDNNNEVHINIISIHRNGEENVQLIGNIPFRVNNNYLFNTILYYLVSKFRANLTLINNNIETLSKLLNNKIVYWSYDTIIVNIYIYIINCILYLHAIIEEIQFVDNRLTEIHDFNAQNDRKENANKAIQEAKIKLSELKSLFEKSYQIFYELSRGLNILINTINSISAYKYINQYNNEFRDDYFINENSNQYTQLYSRSFIPLQIIPESINQFKQLIPQLNFDNINNQNMMNQMKKSLFEKYIPQVTYQNYACYYFDQTSNNIKYYDENDDQIKDNNIVVKLLNGNGTNQIKRVDSNNNQIEINANGKCGRIGYLSDVRLDLPPDLKYGDRDYYYKKQNNERYIDEPYDSHMGNLGLKEMNISKTDKTEKGLSVVGSMIDKHIYILKYIIIVHYLSIINRIVNNEDINDINNDINDESMNHLITLIKTYCDENEDSKKHINILMAKLIDTALINFIKNCILISSNYHTMKILDETIKKDKNIQIPTIETTYKFDLNETIDEVYNRFISPDVDTSYELNYTTILVKGQEINPEEHIIYNYSTSTKQHELQCYKINPNIIDILARYNVQINYRDIDGNTPLFYAVEMQNIENIKRLLKYNASVNSKLSQNTIGITPLIHALNIYDKHLDIFTNPQTLIKSLYKNVEDVIKSKPEYENNMIRYVDNVFGQIILMINHNFFLLTQQYRNGWTYDKYRSMIDMLSNNNMINMNEPVNKTVPILLYIDSTITEGTYGVDNLVTRIKYLDIEIQKLQHKIDDINNRIQNLQTEKADIQSRTDPYYQNRIIEIDELITNLIQNMNSLKIEKTKVQKIKDDTQSSYDRLSQHDQIVAIKSRINTVSLNNSKTAYQLYNKIFFKIINDSNSYKYIPTTNIDTYRSLWDKYLRSPQDQNNITNIPYILTQMQTRTNEAFMNKLINDQEYAKRSKITAEYYRSIVKPFTNDYDTLPLEYRMSNYALDEILDIIIHAIRHNICVQLYHALTKALVRYIRETNTNSTVIFKDDVEYSNYIMGIVNNIMLTSGQVIKGTSIIDYIMDDLPSIAVKFVTNIYEGDDDNDRFINRMQDIFLPILTMLTLNQSYSITKDSSIHKLLETKLFPFFGDIIESTIKESKNMVDNYLRYLQNESKQIEVLDALLNVGH